MKHLSFIVLTIALTLFQHQVVAQRVIDWGVDEVLKPEEIRSDIPTTKVGILVVLKNFAGDTVRTSDSIIASAFINDPADGSVIVSAPPVGFAPRRDMGPGDTMHLSSTMTINGRVNLSANVLFQYRSVVINRGNDDPIKPEENTGQGTNNTHVKSVVWYNVQGWGVGIGDAPKLTGITLYPNPAKEKVHVRWNYQENNSTPQFKVYDLQGKLVQSWSGSENLFDHTIDISSFKKGMYLLEVQIGDRKSSQKLMIQ